jgi:LAO/AO transport system kinase
MPTPVESWAQQIRAGEVRAISRAITAIENHDPVADELLKMLFYFTGHA